MKKIFTSIVLVFIAFTLHAQITVTEADLPAAGDTFIVHIDTNTIVDIGVSDISQHWDFSGLLMDSISYSSFGDPSGLPFVSDFPGTNLYQGNDLVGYAMYTKSVDGLELMGLRSDLYTPSMLNVNYTVPDLIRATPATYGDIFNNSSHWEVAFDAVPADQDTIVTNDVTKTLSYDAWGSLETPYGYYSDVIRVHNYAISVTNAEITFMGFPVTSMEIGRDTTNEYSFFTNNLRYPIATISLNANGDAVEKVQYIFTPVINNDTIISVADGNWTTPTTWDCMCVPTPEDNITIDHSVTLDVDYMVSNALYITANGSLIKDMSPRSFAVTGGYFENYGTFNIDYLLAENSIVENHNMFTIDNSFYNSAMLSNFSVLNGLDSLWSEGPFHNTGEVYADNFTNVADLQNDSAMVFTNFFNAGYVLNNNSIVFNDFTNSGIFDNVELLTGTNDFTNAGEFNNYSNASMTLVNDFLNSNMATFASVFYNDGVVEVTNGWLNNDTVCGTTGSITVSNSTGNTGFMIGSFMFCDLTPPPAYPYIDVNIGTIDPSISFCGVGFDDNQSISNEIIIHPNPITEFASISFNCNDAVNYNIEIMDITGRSIKQLSGISTGEVIFGTENLNTGIYFIKLLINGELYATEKIIIN